MMKFHAKAHRAPVLAAIGAAALMALASGCTPKPKDAAATSAAAPTATSTGTPAAAATASAAAPAAAPAPSAPAVAGAPGETVEAAGKLALNAPVTGEFKTQDAKHHFYKIESNLKVRDLVKLRLENTSATLRPDFKLYDANRSQQGDFYDGTPGASVERVVSLSPGVPIYVEITPNNSVGTYKFSATAQSAYDKYEPNDDQLTTTPANLGAPIEASIMDDKDVDWFHFSGKHGAKIAITLENQSTTLKPDVKWYSATKSQLGDRYDGTPGASLDFTADVEADKDFYVAVQPYSTTGKYKLTVKPAQ